MVPNWLAHLALLARAPTHTRVDGLAILGSWVEGNRVRTALTRTRHVLTGLNGVYLDHKMSIEQ